MSLEENVWGEIKAPRWNKQAKLAGPLLECKSEVNVNELFS